MIQKIDFKAIGMGILINFGGYIGISLLLNVSFMLFEGFFKSLGIPLELFTETMISNTLVIFTLNFICCSFVFFGTYQSCRMAGANEWLNGLITLGISDVLLVSFGGDCSTKETIVWNVFGVSMGMVGIYLASIHNKKELADEKSS